MKGANVIVCDINDDLISNFKEVVSAGYPECTLVLKCDITKDAALDDMFAKGEEMFGRIDYIVNCAGIIDKFDPAGDIERSAWDQIIAVNLTAPTMITKRAVNHMLKHKIKGSIVNVASVASTRGFANGVAYTSSKHGLIGLTKNTAAFYGPKGIRCNAIMPGTMATNIASGLANGVNMEGFGLFRKTFPEDGGMPVCDVEKMANLVSYLCSADAEIINGASWAADGGATAN